MATEPKFSNTPESQPVACNSDESGCAGIRPDEGLRLMNAFLKIRDSSQRARLIEEAERLAG